MQINVSLTQKDLEALILEHIKDATGKHNLTIDHIAIEVKSKQNFKSEWERADFRASLTYTI